MLLENSILLHFVLWDILEFIYLTQLCVRVRLPKAASLVQEGGAVMLSWRGVHLNTGILQRGTKSIRFFSCVCLFLNPQVQKLRNFKLFRKNRGRWKEN